MLEELKELLGEEQFTNLEKYIQSETDKVRTKYTKEIKDLEQYKPKDKTDEEKALEQKVKDLEIKESELKSKENLYKVQDVLSQNKLPKELAKYITLSEDSELETIATEIGSIFNNHVMSNSYKPKDRKKNDGMSKDDFKNMSYAEKEKIFNDSPELFKKLSE